MKQILFVVLTVLFCVSRLSYAVEVSPIEEDIFKLEYARLRVFAVQNDMRFFIDGRPVEKPEWKEPAQQAIKDLEEIKAYVLRECLSGEIKPIVQEFVSVIGKLQDVYTGIESKPDELINDERNKFWKTVGVYVNNAGAYVGKYLNLPDLPEGFDPVDEQRKLFSDDSDRKEFDRLVGLMKEGQYLRALIGFENLWGKYKDMPAEGGILTRLIACDHKRKENGGMRDEEFIAELKRLIDNGVYYPNLSEIFYQWRTLYQMNNHGVSNWSIIPNDEYVEVRWHVMNTVMKHIREHPEDEWAKVELLETTNLPIIERGGGFGSTVIRDGALLFSDILKDKGQKK